jgi:uncharacterized SAM-binding protein YcdF (DUF218 family)
VYESFKLALTTLVLPPGGPILLVIAGVLAWRRYPRAGRGLAAVGAVTLWLCSLPVVAGALVCALGGGAPVDLAAARRADAIVILGGGVRPQAAEYGGDTLGRLTLERVRYGAFLARQTGRPVLVTGGAPELGVRAEADLMREVLEREFGVAVRWVEDRARNTRENAESAARLLTADGKRRVVLVTHAFDVRRATADFASRGLEVVAAPTLVPRCEHPELADLLPHVGALYTTHFVVYEMLAIWRDAGRRWLSGSGRPR